ncbi:uncharacterized protein HD556DRAFT_1441162 [Suillus plorans]|uniref:Uncharacterized protein n=1 Tax=Suillus plorans TaxID=116603 RepID=A0A9P7DKD9_9AGAM|nr:uncharacterized protein HD556DRAFT_1441162 [Suillus plorans]KAG1796986.1 hypothetical protein HD556DRAFT_1441162 [Suillus plorans]
MANAELWSSPVVQALFIPSPPAPLSPKILSANLNVIAEASAYCRYESSTCSLLNDDFNGCRELVQTQEGNPYSDHLHSIAHRREPDYWNSRYWIERFSHEHLPEIYSPGGTITQAKQEMERFVDAVQIVETSGKGVLNHEKTQWEEMTMLARILIHLE